jgi:FlgD Ig-like domain
MSHVRRRTCFSILLLIATLISAKTTLAANGLIEDGIGSHASEQADVSRLGAGIVGACCLPSGECVELDRVECQASGHWQGAGTTCASFQCVPATAFQRELLAHSRYPLGRGLEIAVDTEDNPSIVYWEDVTGRTRFARKANSAWTFEEVDHGAEGGYWWIDMALDGAGRTHVTYMVGVLLPGSEAIKYAVKDGSTWSREVVVAPALGVSRGNSIALMPDGSPCIAYAQNDADVNGDEFTKLVFAEKQGGAWRFEIVEAPDYTVNCGTDCSVAIDSDGNPHVMYGCDGTRYAFREGGAWTIEMVANVRGTGFALDVDGGAHVGYYDPDLGGLTYATRTGGAWARELVWPTPGTQTSPSSMSLDSDGQPHFCFTVIPSAPTEATLHYARKAAAGWSIQAIDVRRGSGYRSRAAALDGAGDLHVAYMEWTHKNVMYAREVPMASDTDALISVGLSGGMGAVLLALTVTPNPIGPDGASISCRTLKGELSELAGYDVSGRRVASISSGEHSGGAWTLHWRGVDDRGRRLVPGTYFLRLTSSHGDQVRERVTIVR